MFRWFLSPHERLGTKQSSNNEHRGRFLLPIPVAPSSSSSSSSST
eukprot:COSAG06_NODE_9298_length_1934_cov_1.645777_3_plen_44_part_01